MKPKTIWSNIPGINLMRTITQKEINSFEKRYPTNLIHCLSGIKSINLIGTKNKQGSTFIDDFHASFVDLFPLKIGLEYVNISPIPFNDTKPINGRIVLIQ